VKNKKNWDDFLLPNGATVGELRKENLDWWMSEGAESERPIQRQEQYNQFVYIAKMMNKEFSWQTYENKQLKIGEVCGGPFGGMIEHKFALEDKYQIDIYADSFKELEWTSSPSENTTWIEAPCEEIPLEDNFLDVVFGFNSIDHGWDVFQSIKEIIRVSKECYISFDTDRYLLDGYPDRHHYQTIKLEDVQSFMQENYQDSHLYSDMSFMVRPISNPSLKVFYFWVKKK
tara:strand:+ start:2175 stop:2864 length:690 start_codon:yes stop_codon:yes gene_type:complete